MDSQQFVHVSKALLEMLDKVGEIVKFKLCQVNKIVGNKISRNKEEKQLPKKHHEFT